MTRISHLVVVGACVVTTASLVEAQHSSLLRVRLVVETMAPYDRLSGTTWTALMKECQRIWRAERVDVVGDESGADVSIPLVFDHRELVKYDSSRGSAFGVTIFRGRTRRIVVSSARARDAAYQDGAGFSVSSSAEIEATMGRILGRVVAHEIGHVLLHKAGHGTVGLMRPQVDVRHLQRGNDDQFALSLQERAWLATLFRAQYARGGDDPRTAARRRVP
jgi:hypothetical protein